MHIAAAVHDVGPSMYVIGSRTRSKFEGVTGNSVYFLAFLYKNFYLVDGVNTYG